MNRGFITGAYPSWMYYPANARPPDWIADFVSVVADARSVIDSARVAGLSSNQVLEGLRPGLEGLGYSVEVSRRSGDRVREPVLFGPQGSERVSYEVDGVHPSLGVVLEVEAGRGAMSNAIYRDLIRASLLVDARYFVLGVMLIYGYSKRGRRISEASYERARDLLDAVYASGRLRLPFEGLLLFGY